MRPIFLTRAMMTNTDITANLEKKIDNLFWVFSPRYLWSPPCNIKSTIFSLLILYFFSINRLASFTKIFSFWGDLIVFITSQLFQKVNVNRPSSWEIFFSFMDICLSPWHQFLERTRNNMIYLNISDQTATNYIHIKIYSFCHLFLHHFI